MKEKLCTVCLDEGRAQSSALLTDEALHWAKVAPCVGAILSVVGGLLAAGQDDEVHALVDAAERMGIDVSWVPLPEDRLADVNSQGTKIRVGTHDPGSFFHELAHAAHARLNGGSLKGGQDATQETVAEFTAAVLMELYGMGDRSGYCWQYIKMYSSDPLTAVVKALSTTEKVLALLEGEN